MVRQYNSGRATILSAVAALGVLSLQAKVELGVPFTDGAVLQRGREVPVWGTAEPGAKVTVSFAGMERETTAGADGEWCVSLGAMDASCEGRTLVAESGGERAEAKDVLVGEVWFCAGQSNAELPLCGHSPHFRDAKGFMRAQMTHKPLVRFCHQSNYRKSPVPKKTAPKSVEWKPFTPENLAAPPSFSAMGVYFALEVHNATGVPVGIVGTYWGGTKIEPWTPNGELWNEMVAPWTPFAIRGVIWYQGCGNSRDGLGYADKMHDLYNGWSREFRNPGLKLYFVQLAPCIRRSPEVTCDWSGALIATTEGQGMFAAAEKNAGMVVINDVGNIEEIHPNDKETVGQRLALLALKRDYGFVGIQADSPTLKEWKIDGDRFLLSFDNVESWYLYHSDWSTASGFEIAGVDGKFVPAVIENLLVKEQGVYKSKGVIEGKDLVVRAPDVAEPKKLRYLYSRPWYGALHNESNLPLGAFHIGE